LPVHMDELYSTSVGAQFGVQALNQTVLAGIVGVALIFLFMVAYYRFPGLITSINLVIYVYLIVLVFGLMNGVLTLPGIAARLFAVGLAVDANVITFERIKEELKLVKAVKAASKAGTKNSLSTIIDANITTLLAAVVLFVFGTSSVEGFATMLIVSILVSFVTAVYGTRLLLGLWVKSRVLNRRPGWFGVKQAEIQDIAQSKDDVEPTFFNRYVNIVGHRKKFFVVSSIMVLLGVVSIALFQLNPGIDFTAGSRIEIIADETLTTNVIEESLDDLDLETTSIVISGDENDRATARFDTVLPEDKIAEIKNYFSDQYGNEPS